MNTEILLETMELLADHDNIQKRVDLAENIRHLLRRELQVLKVEAQRNKALLEEEKEKSTQLYERWIEGDRRASILSSLVVYGVERAAYIMDYQAVQLAKAGFKTIAIRLLTNYRPALKDAEQSKAYVEALMEVDKNEGNQASQDPVVVD